MQLSNRIQEIKPSATMVVAARAKALKAKGIEIISFGLGEPDFPSASVASEAGIQAIQTEDTHYTAPAGTDHLKDAIIHKLKRDNDLHYERNQVIASCGAKHTLYNIAQCLYGPGDEVIVPAPYWVTYPDQIKLAGATPVVIETKEEEGFLVMPEALEAAITPRTKGIIFNSPSNPTGAIYAKKDYEAVLDLLLNTPMWVISDEIYETFLYEGAGHLSPAALSSDMKRKTIVVNGVSKAYSMTGWRIGYAAGPEEVISAMTKLQGQSTSNPTSISQAAAAAALNDGAPFVAKMLAEFKPRRALMLSELNQMPGVSCAAPAGAFYVFPNIKGLLGRAYGETQISTATELASFLLEEAGVTTVPGEAFGAPGYLRLSFASAESELKRGLQKIKDALKKLS